MKTFALLSLVAVSVSAKSNSSSASSSSGWAPAAAATAAPIPTSSVSSGCGSFLSSMDSDSSLQSCLAAVNGATSAITSNSSSSDITTALGNVCGSSTTSACSQTLFRQKLTSFLASCQAELTGNNPNTNVQQIYDSLYTMPPFMEAVCSQDTSSDYCVTTIASQAASATPGLLALVQSYLQVVISLPFSKRDVASPFSSTGTYATPNATTFQNASIPFLFLTPTTPQATLCSTCSSEVLKPYLQWESSIANALGVDNSFLLGGQKALWTAVQNQCGSTFTSGVVANAGAAPSSNVTVGSNLSGAMSVKASAGGVIAALIGAFFAL